MVFEKKYYDKKDRLFDSDEDISYTDELSTRKSRFTKLLYWALALTIVFLVTRYYANISKHVVEKSPTKLEADHAIPIRFDADRHTIPIQLEAEHQAAVFEDTESSVPPSCDLISDDFRFDCFPRGQADQSSCEERGCCWLPASASSKVPFCYFPKNFHSYKVVNVTKSSRGLTLILNITANSVYPDDVKSLKMSVYFETPTRLRVKIIDNENMRYEPPYPEVPVMGHSSRDLQYSILVNEQTFGFAVVRKETGEIIFDVRNVGGFIYSNQFLQLSALIPSRFIYGLGEQRNNFLLNTDWEEITLFNHGNPPVDHTNLYGSHPFYLAMENNGFSHGVFLLNSNAMDIILQPAPAITYRTIGGVLDFYFFLGPSPAEVVQQYTEVIGYPFLPPYWSLGFHLSRFGLKNLNETQVFWQRNRDTGIPFDVMWNDIDYMETRNDFTISQSYSGLDAFVKKVHDAGMKYIIILDPGVASHLPRGTYPPYDEGIISDIFVKDSSNAPIEGSVWNNPKGTVFPDFTNPNVIPYWLQLISNLYKEINFDGLWLDMNEIENFVDGSVRGCPPDDNSLDNPPYVPRVQNGKLNSRTLCMNAKHHAGSHYDVHNIYAFAEGISTSFCLATVRAKRPFILSRSTFAGSGRFVAHWTGDVYSTWDDMKHSVADIMSFNLFGIPMVGADICGFNGNSNKELCQRWLQLGAFYPFSRNHNSDDAIDQDPAVWGKDVIESTKKAMKMRYHFLPYLYTLFWNAHRNGGTVVRPLFFEFPEDPVTYTANTQFFWGSALLVVPVLTENATVVTSYFPAATWIDAYTLEMHKSNGDYINLSAPLDTIPLYLRFGNIIPFQEPGETIFESRKNPFGLYVLLNDNGDAFGELYWDDGDNYLTENENLYNHLKFQCSSSVISGLPVFAAYNETMILGTVYVVGVPNSVNSIQVNNQKHTNYTWTPELEKLEIKNVGIDLRLAFNITWN